MASKRPDNDMKNVIVAGYATAACAMMELCRTDSVRVSELGLSFSTRLSVSHPYSGFPQLDVFTSIGGQTKQATSKTLDYFVIDDVLIQFVDGCTKSLSPDCARYESGEWILSRGDVEATRKFTCTSTTSSEVTTLGTMGAESVASPTIIGATSLGYVVTSTFQSFSFFSRSTRGFRGVAGRITVHALTVMNGPSEERSLQVTWLDFRLMHGADSMRALQFNERPRFPLAVAEARPGAALRAGGSIYDAVELCTDPVDGFTACVQVVHCSRLYTGAPVGCTREASTRVTLFGRRMAENGEVLFLRGPPAAASVTSRSPDLKAFTAALNTPFPPDGVAPVTGQPVPTAIRQSAGAGKTTEACVVSYPVQGGLSASFRPELARSRYGLMHSAHISRVVLPGSLTVTVTRPAAGASAARVTALVRGGVKMYAYSDDGSGGFVDPAATAEISERSPRRPGLAPSFHGEWLSADLDATAAGAGRFVSALRTRLACAHVGLTAPVVHADVACNCESLSALMAEIWVALVDQMTGRDVFSALLWRFDVYYAVTGTDCWLPTVQAAEGASLSCNLRYAESAKVRLVGDAHPHSAVEIPHGGGTAGDLLPLWLSGIAFTTSMTVATPWNVEVDAVRSAQRKFTLEVGYRYCPSLCETAPLLPYAVVLKYKSPKGETSVRRHFMHGGVVSVCGIDLAQGESFCVNDLDLRSVRSLIRDPLTADEHELSQQAPKVNLGTALWLKLSMKGDGFTRAWVIEKPNCPVLSLGAAANEARSAVANKVFSTSLQVPMAPRTVSGIAFSMASAPAIRCSRVALSAKAVGVWTGLRFDVTRAVEKGTGRAPRDGAAWLSFGAAVASVHAMQLEVGTAKLVLRDVRLSLGGRSVLSAGSVVLSDAAGVVTLPALWTEEQRATVREKPSSGAGTSNGVRMRLVNACMFGRYASPPGGARSGFWRFCSDPVDSEDKLCAALAGMRRHCSPLSVELVVEIGDTKFLLHRFELGETCIRSKHIVPFFENQAMQSISQANRAVVDAGGFSTKGFKGVNERDYRGKYRGSTTNTALIEQSSYVQDTVITDRDDWINEDAEAVRNTKYMFGVRRTWEVAALP